MDLPGLRPVLATRETPNYLVHPLLTLLTCFGSIVWVIDALRTREWRCTSCGSIV